MNGAQGEQGMALVAAVAVLMVILAIGLSLVHFTDTEQRSAAREQWSEQAFNLAEAALNAQIGQLARTWPSSQKPFEIRCTEAITTPTNGCPSTLPLSTYGKTNTAACAAGARPEAWGSPLTNGWTTYVRDDAASSTYFESSAEKSEPAFDANKDNKLWVRAVGVVDCRIVTLVSLVSRQLTTIPFPKNVVSANWFVVTNKGKKEIVIAEGEGGQPGEFSLRCEGREAGTCEEWEPSKEQIKPYIKGPANPSVLLTESQLEAVKSFAEAEGTYFTTALGNCPLSVAQLTGKVVWLECGNLLFTSNGTVDSAETPGFIVVANGSIAFKGTTTIYGAIYARNPTNSPGASIVLGGTTTIYGTVDVDGLGGVELGSSKVNLVYYPKAITELQGSAGATPTRDTFRVLPISQ